jgi:hypothetical protein
MANIGALKAWVPFEVPLSADMNANFAEIKSKFNTYAVQTDVQRTMSVDFLFTDALYDIGKAGATRPRDIFASRDITASGVVNAVGGVVLTGGSFASGKIYGDATLGLAIGAKAGATWDLSLLSPSGSGIILVPTGTRDVYIPSGILLHGTLTTTGVTAGEVVLAHTKGIFGLNDAGAVLNLIRSNTQTGVAHRVEVGDNTIGVVTIGRGIQSTGAAGGDLIIANAKAFRAVNAAGTSTFRMIYSNANDGIVLAGDGGIVQIGNPSTTTSAVAGDVVVGNTKWLRGANAGGTSARPLIGFGADSGAREAVFIAPAPDVVAIGNPATLAGAGAGDVVLANAKALLGVNAAGTALSGLIRRDASDRVSIAHNDSNVIFGAGAISIGTTVLTSAAAGDLILQNNKAIRSVNAGGTDTNVLITLQSTDEIQLGSGGNQNVKVGKAAAASLSTAAGPRDGTIILDTTNNRLIYYVGGLRFWLAGTSF